MGINQKVEWRKEDIEGVLERCYTFKQINQKEMYIVTE